MVGGKLVPTRVARIRRPVAALTNHILSHLPAPERTALLKDAEYVVLPAGETVARAGELVSTAFFPETGLISSISEMATGHHCAVTVVGEDGVLGLEPLFNVTHHPFRLVSLLRSAGYRLPTERLLEAFDQSVSMRVFTLEHVGHLLTEIATLAACSRVHSHRHRLARWLLVMSDKAQQSSLPITHDVLADLVGGPRHAVTIGLNHLKKWGAVAHVRGRIDILNRGVLVANACECYGRSIR